MSKLYFFYGTVCSSKTLNLLAVYKNYEVQGKKAILLRPDCDSRSKNVESRIGFSATPDIVINSSDSIIDKLIEYINNIKTIDVPELLSSCLNAIIVDECQFFTEEQINEFRKISIGIVLEYEKTNNNIVFKKSNKNDLYKKPNTIKLEIPVMCYGLRTDSNGFLWKASSILMAQSDEIHEIKTICSYCSKRAVFSMVNPERNNVEEKVNPSWGYYIPVCPTHFFENINEEK